MRRVHEGDNSEAVLLVDAIASNAFNSLNRQAALRNVHILYPILVPVLINTYQSEAKLFIGGDHIQSQEGTSVGDPLALVMYAIDTLPLIQSLKEGVVQSWYVDDASAGGTLAPLCRWWDRLQAEGPQFSYYPNAEQTWLIVKLEHAKSAEKHFQSTGIRITAHGERRLGAALGWRSFVKSMFGPKWTHVGCQLLPRHCLHRVNRVVLLDFSVLPWQRM